MPHILLLEDDSRYARHIIELLKKQDTPHRKHRITHVSSMQEAVERLSRPHKFDLVLSNITLPDSRGKQTVQTISRLSANLPLLFITDQNVEALAVAAMKHGAQDYLVKGKHDGDALARAIRYAVERQRYQRALQQVQHEAAASQQNVVALAQQKRQLVELNRVKDEFIRLASHQLRTPATAVKQYLNLVLEGHFGDMDPQLFRLLSSAAASNERQLIVINDLVKTAQLDSGAYSLKLKSTDLTGLIRETIAGLRPMFSAKHQTVSFDDSTTFIAQVDPDELRAVIENILENASKYSAEGKPIMVRIGKVAKFITIHITDEGVGIADTDQKRIFDKFTRVNNDESDTVSGSGLGLYIARRIMRLHGGSISVRSEPHMGSTFILKVPASHG